MTAAEDPLLREVALGSAMPDTAARLKVVWQVLPLPGSQLELEDGANKDQVRAAFAKWARRRRRVRGWRRAASGPSMRTRTRAW